MSNTLSDRVGMALVTIHLSSGDKIIVPVSLQSTVSQLAEETVRRAVVLNIYHNKNDKILRLQDGSILFAEDKLADILTLTIDSHFYLGSSCEDLTLYIRWITPSRALKYSSLKSLPAERIHIKTSATVAEFKELALKRLRTGHILGDDRLLPNATIELYLENCYLSSLGPGTTRLIDLELSGTKTQPLNIFVVFIAAIAPTSLNSLRAATPDQAWAFESTDRGKATFQTCLNMLLKEIHDGKVELDRLLGVLWNVTHFPPALLAFRKLHEDGHQRLDPFPCAIFASAFRELCKISVPEWVSPYPEHLLESSRQLFAWLCYLSIPFSKSPDVSYQELIHKIELKEMNAEAPDETNQAGRLKFDITTEIRVLNSTVVDDPLPSGPLFKKVLVSVNNSDRVNPAIIATAMWGFYKSPYNFYFAIPPNEPQLDKHELTTAPHTQDFDYLLQVTDLVANFKMIGPLQLGACTSSTLPVLTLDSQGYVSKYDQQDEMCGTREFYTENVFRKEVLSGFDPGQFLLRKLNPIIEERKKARSWEIDAWSKDSKTVDSRMPEEGVVICVDRSSSMGTPMGHGWTSDYGNETTGDRLIRLSEVKEVFKNLVTRISAYRLPTHLGLVTFAGQVDVCIGHPLTPVLYDFQNRLSELSSDGSTAIFDALLKAKQMLGTFATVNPKAKCRIILLTDGEDNGSRHTPADVCKQLYDHDIVLDVIVIGRTATSDLFKIAKHTGGYAFNPTSRDLLFQTFLLDGFIDIHARIDVQKIPLCPWAKSVPKVADMQDKFSFPPRRPHVLENSSFISLHEAGRAVTRMGARTQRSTSSSWSSTMSTSSITVRSTRTSILSSPSGHGRIFLNEVSHMVDKKHPDMDVYINKANIGFWKVVMVGPPGSAYEQGTFVLSVDIGDRFPLEPPSVRFITPVLHPNITKHGKICHEIFNREWRSDLHVYDVLLQILGIFYSIEARDAVDPLFTLRYWTDPIGGRREVEEYINRFALKSRQKLCFEILNCRDQVALPTVLECRRLSSSSISTAMNTPSTTQSTDLDTWTNDTPSEVSVPRPSNEMYYL